MSERLPAIGRPMCLDDAPDLAFRPEKRFERPRPDAEDSAIGAGLKTRMNIAYILKEPGCHVATH